jgi:glycerophosphoryl diester phosphodiesterase
MNNHDQGFDDNRQSRRWGQRGLGCLIFVIILFIAYYGLYFILKITQPKSPQLIAHRGGPVYNPENTMMAFQHAIDIGSDWIEFDVQRTSDNVLVVIHDETVDRTTNGSGTVSEMTLDQIQGLDAGSGQQVPTFEQVIALAKENGVGILPEAKSPHLYPGLAEQMVNTIEDQAYNHHAIIQSFDPDPLYAVAQEYPEQALCPLYGLWEFDLSSPEPLDVDYVCPMAEMVLLYPWMIRQAHQDGKEAYVWFGIIESPLVMRIMLAMGADALMVDDTVALAGILGRNAK